MMDEDFFDENAYGAAEDRFWEQADTEHILSWMTLIINVHIPEPFSYTLRYG
jgi:hypothetical protein